MYKTLITEPAEQDIRQAVRYITKELQNPGAANRLLDDIEKALVTLGKAPKIHALLKNEKLANLGFRVLSVHKYLVFYIVREDTKSVTIERFLHSRRDWIHMIGQQGTK